MAYNPNTMSFDLPSTDTVYVSGLPLDVSEQDIQDYFGSIGVIKLDKKTKKQKIWLYRDKETGALKGDGTVSYEDPFSAGSAVEWFNNKEWKGSMLSVSLAESKQGSGPPPGGYPRGGGGFGGGGGGGGKPGDWACPNCGNNCFAFRQACNRCQTPKPGGGGGDGGGGYGGGGRGGYGGGGGGYGGGGGGRGGGGGGGYGDDGGYPAPPPAAPAPAAAPPPQAVPATHAGSPPEYGGGGSGGGAGAAAAAPPEAWSHHDAYGAPPPPQPAAAAPPAYAHPAVEQPDEPPAPYASSTAAAGGGGGGGVSGGGAAGKKKVVAAPQGPLGLFTNEDWACPSCGNMNWQRRKACNLCGAAKPGTLDVRREGQGGGFKELDEQELAEARKRRKQFEDQDMYDEFGRLKKQFREGQDRRAREAAALARLHGATGGARSILLDSSALQGPTPAAAAPPPPEPTPAGGRDRERDRDRDRGGDRGGGGGGRGDYHRERDRRDDYDRRDDRGGDRGGRGDRDRDRDYDRRR